MKRHYQWLIIWYVYYSRWSKNPASRSQEIPFEQNHDIDMSYFWSTCVHLGFSEVRVALSLVLCVCFVDRCLSFCTFFCHCVVCSSSIYGFWLPLWYLQTLLLSYVRYNNEHSNKAFYLGRIFNLSNKVRSAYSMY